MLAEQRKQDEQDEFHRLVKARAEREASRSRANSIESSPGKTTEQEN